MASITAFHCQSEQTAAALSKGESQLRVALLQGSWNVVASVCECCHLAVRIRGTGGNL